MQIVHFYGAIHPKHHKLTAHKPFGGNWGTGDFGFPLVMEGSVSESSIEVTCVLPHFDDSMISILLARATNLIRAFSDTVAFATGAGLVVVWEIFKKPDGSTMLIQKVNADVAKFCEAYKFPPSNGSELVEFEKVIQIVLAEPNLLGSMTDLGDTLAFYHQTPTNCGRVLDSLRRAVAPNDKPSKGWKVLQEVVNVDESFMKLVSDKSTNPRHGDRESPMSASEVQQIAQRTWQIMNRFIEYRKRGSQALPLSDFPILYG